MTGVLKLLKLSCLLKLHLSVFNMLYRIYLYILWVYMYVFWIESWGYREIYAHQEILTVPPERFSVTSWNIKTFQDLRVTKERPKETVIAGNINIIDYCCKVSSTISSSSLNFLKSYIRIFLVKSQLSILPH